MLVEVTKLSPLELHAFITDLVEQKDNAYSERNKCVALIVRMAIALGLKAGRWYHEGEEEGWGWIVCVCLPTGWVDWHVPDSEVSSLEDIPVIEKEWEGYSTDEKYSRVLTAFRDEND